MLANKMTDQEVRIENENKSTKHYLNNQLSS